MPNRHACLVHLSVVTFIVTTWLVCSSGCNPSKPAKSDLMNKAPIQEPAVEQVAVLQHTSSDEDSGSEMAKPESLEPNAETTNDQPSKPEPSKPEPTWSIQRWIALAPTGPVIIELAANICDEDLETASEKAVQQAIKQIAADLPRPWSWDKLLDHKLIRSGWLGNLLPDSTQRSQVTGMYNSDGDEEVQDAEFSAFLSRGLSRGPSLRFTDVGVEPDSMNSNSSPWGKLDLNQDNQLDSGEVSSLLDRALRFDVNGDRILTLQELRSDRSVASGSMNSDTGLLNVSTSIPVDKKSTKRVGKLVLEHYTFLGTIARDQFSGLDDELWNQMDTNHDMTLSQSELDRLAELPCHVRIEASFDNSGKDAAQLNVVSNRSDSKYNSRRVLSGKLNSQRFTIGIASNDSYAAGARQLFRQQLSAAFDNPQVQMFIRTQLQLGENAFEVLDEDADKKLNDMEFEQAWLWTTATRSNRLVLRWMTIVQNVWFSVADADGDQRVTEVELQELVKRLPLLDSNKDGSVSPDEIPFVAKLEINRIDPRIPNTPNPMTQAPTLEDSVADWFAANDSNNDGFVSKLEFLGTSDDFAGYDRDNDGFISRQETYEVK